MAVDNHRLGKIQIEIGIEIGIEVVFRGIEKK